MIRFLCNLQRHKVNHRDFWHGSVMVRTSSCACGKYGEVEIHLPEEKQQMAVGYTQGGRYVH